MIVQLNQMWVRWTAQHTIEEAQRMVAKHRDAFTIIHMVIKGLVIPTQVARVGCLQELWEAIDGSDIV